MLYPFRSLDCPTNPLVTMRNITLRNVTSVEGVNRYPGVIICNVSNPCTDFVFENVHMQVWLIIHFTVESIVEVILLKL